MRVLLLPFAVLLALPVSAQTLWVQGGVAGFDLSGTGTAPVLDLRVSTPLSPAFGLEGGLGLTNTDQQYGDVAYLLPSAEVTAGLGRRVRAVLGVGVGAFVPLTDPPETATPFGGRVDYDPDTEAYLSFSAGAQAAVSARLAVRLGGRLRATVSAGGPDLFGGTFGEITGSLGVQL